jgi:hypothetical protein
MWIISDDGNSTVNTDQVFSFDRALMGDGNEAAMAIGVGNIRTVLALGDHDRVLRTLDLIQKAIASRKVMLDLRTALGMRADMLPDLQREASRQRAAVGGLMIPGGMPDPQAVVRAAEEAQRRAGNGGG